MEYLQSKEPSELVNDAPQRLLLMWTEFEEPMLGLYETCFLLVDCVPVVPVPVLHVLELEARMVVAHLHFGVFQDKLVYLGKHCKLRCGR